MKNQKNIDKIYIYGKSRLKIKKQINLSEISIIKNNLKEVINTLWNDLSDKNYKAVLFFLTIFSEIFVSSDNFLSEKPIDFI